MHVLDDSTFLDPLSWARAHDTEEVKDYLLAAPCARLEVDDVGVVEKQRDEAT